MRISVVIATVFIVGLGASSARSQPYTLQTVIAIPPTAANVQPGNGFTSFDIGYFDPVSRNYFNCRPLGAASLESQHGFVLRLGTVVCR